MTWDASIGWDAGVSWDATDLEIKQFLGLIGSGDDKKDSWQRYLEWKKRQKPRRRRIKSSDSEEIREEIHVNREISDELPPVPLRSEHETSYPEIPIEAVFPELVRVLTETFTPLVLPNPPEYPYPIDKQETASVEASNMKAAQEAAILAKRKQEEAVAIWMMMAA